MGECPIDPSLPSLETILDATVVIRRAIEVGALDPTTRSLKRRTTAWTPGEGCLATYEVRSGSNSPDPRPRDVLVVRAGPTGWLYSSATDDPALPGLRPTLTGDIPIVSYKPGESCVVDLGERQFAKLVPPTRLASLKLAFDELGRVAAIDPAAPGVPRVLATDPELGLLVMERVPGASLHDLVSISPDAARASCEQLGAALASMHLHRDTPLAARRVVDDDDEVRRCISAAKIVAPTNGDRLETLLDAATSQAKGLPLGAIGPAHGVLRTDQAIVNEGRPVLVDLDGACAAPPERDLANFSAYLWWRSVRKPGDAASLLAMAAAATNGWRSVGDAPELDDDCTRIWRALSLLKIAGRRYRNLTRAEWPLVPQLLDEAAACL